jgi:hypothetical protein
VLKRWLVVWGASPLGDGGGSGGVPWATLEEGLEKARRYRVPILVMVQMGPCQPCGLLKLSLSFSEPFVELSSRFVCVSVEERSATDLLRPQK